MEFSPLQNEILFAAWVLARDADPAGQVVEDWAIPAADQLADAGWLQRQTQENGDAAYFWTPQAETALDGANLITSQTVGREN